jgi:hypothetical protein
LRSPALINSAKVIPPAVLSIEMQFESLRSFHHYNLITVVIREPYAQPVNLYVAEVTAHHARGECHARAKMEMGKPNQRKTHGNINSSESI